LQSLIGTPQQAFAAYTPPALGAPSAVLTVTKQVNGVAPTGQIYSITLDGPSFTPPSVTTILAGQSLTYSVAPGIYTVTEASPGAGWLVTSTASGSAITTPVVSGSQAVVTLTNVITAATVAPGAITGRVYKDFNGDGSITANGVLTETGVQSVTVTAFDRTGAAVGSTTTNATGNYTVTPSASGPWRIEFTTMPAGYEPSARGAQNGTSTQFVSTSGAGNINLGVNDPNEYSQANPLMISPAQLNGQAAGNTLEGLVSFDYTASGVCAAGPVCPTALHNKVADIAEVGSTWGVAWQPTKRQIYVSSLMKRHADFADSPSTVYVFTKTGATINAAFSKFSLQGVAPANGGAAIDLGSVCRRSATDGDANANCLPSGGVAGDYTLVTPVSSPNIDFDAFGKVGKISYGDADMSEDDKTL